MNSLLKYIVLICSFSIFCTQIRTVSHGINSPFMKIGEYFPTNIKRNDTSYLDAVKLVKEKIINETYSNSNEELSINQIIAYQMLVSGFKFKIYSLVRDINKTALYETEVFMGFNYINDNIENTVQKAIMSHQMKEIKHVELNEQKVLQIKQLIGSSNGNELIDMTINQIEGINNKYLVLYKVNQDDKLQSFLVVSENRNGELVSK